MQAKDVRPPAIEHDAVTGREIYVTHVSVAMESTARGIGHSTCSKPTDLTHQRYRSHRCEFIQRIHDGKANTAMGAWSYALSDDEIGDVLAYVRTLRSE